MTLESSKYDRMESDRSHEATARRPLPFFQADLEGPQTRCDRDLLKNLEKTKEL